MPDYSEYQNAVIEHIDGLKKARIDEYVENQKEKDNIELAAKNVIDRIRKGEEEFIKILVESYEELKRLSMVFPYKYIV
ncbi:MAG: hypothetical protein QG670_1272 [Thermoproteota archaeon]|nr:hypothetical protein [Thermoproteota archaeon]